MEPFTVENIVTEQMTVKEYYSALVELSAQFIEKHGFKRSGRSGIFYKYNADKSRGYLIGFRKSLENTPDFCVFRILFGIVSIDELHELGVHRDKINLQDLKNVLMNGYSMESYGHRVDDFVVENDNVNDYFQFNILPELEKTVAQLSVDQ